MPTIAITNHDLKQLCECQKLLCDILASQQHTHGGGLKVPQAIVYTWDRVKEQCDLLCRHWEQNEMSMKVYNLLLFSKVKWSLMKLESAIRWERGREMVTDDIQYKDWEEARPNKDGLRPSDQPTRYRQFEPLRWNNKHGEWTHAPGVAAYLALSTLLELTKEKGWIAAIEPQTNLDKGEFYTRDNIYFKHMKTVEENLKNAWIVSQKAEHDHSVNAASEKD